jgi:hypothetical protein
VRTHRAARLPRPRSPQTAHHHTLLRTRPRPHLTRVKRMSPSSEPHEYRGFHNGQNGGVYIVAARTHYPVKRREGVPGGSSSETHLGCVCSFDQIPQEGNGIIQEL